MFVLSFFRLIYDLGFLGPPSSLLADLYRLVFSVTSFRHWEAKHAAYFKLLSDKRCDSSGMTLVLDASDGSHFIKYLRVRAEHLLEFCGLPYVSDIRAEYHGYEEYEQPPKISNPSGKTTSSNDSQFKKVK